MHLFSAVGYALASSETATRESALVFILGGEAAFALESHAAARRGADQRSEPHAIETPSAGAGERPGAPSGHEDDERHEQKIAPR